MIAGCAGKIPPERVPYLSALEVCWRRGAIQIHVYLYLPMPRAVDVSYHNFQSTNGARRRVKDALHETTQRAATSGS